MFLNNEINGKYPRMSIPDNFFSQKTSSQKLVFTSSCET